MGARVLVAKLQHLRHGRKLAHDDCSCWSREQKHVLFDSDAHEAPAGVEVREYRYVQI